MVMPLSESLSATAVLHSVVTELVVPAPFFGIGEDFICFCSLFETIFCCFVARVLIGVVSSSPASGKLF